MDLSMISAAASAITVSKELAKAALGVRDFNEMAPVVAKLNEQLLKAQESLFGHQAQLLTLQQEHFETTEKLRKVEKALAERGRYTLIELSPGNLVYTANVTPVDGDAINPARAEPPHHVCQPCFDKGTKAVLRRSVFYGAEDWTCPVCNTEVRGARVSE
jgi:hypothetical protein